VGWSGRRKLLFPFPSITTRQEHDNMTTTQISANGTVRHQLGTGSDKKFVVQYRAGGSKDAPQVKREYSGVFVNFPVTPAALEEAFSKYTFKVGGVELKGVHAAAAAKWLHATESVRGDVRKALESGLTTAANEDNVRRMYVEYTGPSGERQGFKPTVVDGGRVAAFVAAGDLDGLTAYLAECGAKVNAVVETVDELDEDDTEV
jgi:hypothetical protein